MRKGVVLLVVSIVLIVITLMGIGVLVLTNNQTRIAQNNIQRLRAYYAARAAIVDTFSRLYNGQPVLNNQRINDLAVRVTVGNVDPNTGLIPITVTVDYFGN